MINRLPPMEGDKPFSKAPNDKTYAMSCVNCGTQNSLTMVAHRNGAGYMVGWVFVCSRCLSDVGGKYFKFEII